MEKIKTIGDAYMAAGGLPSSIATHAVDVVKAALEMAEAIEKGKAVKIAAGMPYFDMRIGVHTGPVVAGIVGVKKFQYDKWGDTVSIASRPGSSREVGMVNISQSRYEQLKENPELSSISRGKIKTKGKGEIAMYFVNMKQVSSERGPYLT
jgi:class 3 adenylate cyclase